MPDDERPDDAPAPRYRRERRPSVVDFEELEALKALTLPKGAAAPAPAPAAAEAPNIMLSRQGTRSTFSVPVPSWPTEALRCIFYDEGELYVVGFIDQRLEGVRSSPP